MYQEQKGYIMFELPRTGCTDYWCYGERTCPPKNLKIDQLELDVLNPRLKKPADQHEAMQQILDDQGVKLGNLAESVVEDGLSPMDRLLVIKSETANGKYTVLEGNRRTLVLKILKNPNVLTGLTVSQGLQKKLERLANGFDTRALEPLASLKSIHGWTGMRGLNSGISAKMKVAASFAGPASRRHGFVVKPGNSGIRLCAPARKAHGRSAKAA